MGGQGIVLTGYDKKGLNSGRRGSREGSYMRVKLREFAKKMI